MVVSSLDQKLTNIDPTEWYDAFSLKELGLTHTRFLDGTNGHLMRDIKGMPHVLGASLVYRLKSENGMHQQQGYIDIMSLAIALENPYVFEMRRTDPYLFVMENIGGYPIPSVPLELLVAFNNIPAIEGRLEFEEQQRLLSMLPEVTLNLSQIGYLSNHRNDPVSRLAQTLELPEPVVNVALYKLGYMELPTREATIAYEQRLGILYGKTPLDISHKSKQTIAKKYPYAPLYALEEELSLPGSVIEDVAAFLGVQRVNPSSHYTLTEISTFFSDYDELRQAMFKGLLKTQYHREKNDNYLSTPVLTVSGQSLLDYLNDRDAGIVDAKRAKTRADKYVFNPDSSRDWENPEVYSRVFDPHLSQFTNFASRNPLLSYDESREFLQRVKQGDMLALNDLVEANYRLLIHLSRKFDARRMSRMDYIQEGVFGLIEAALNFDINKAQEDVAGEAYGKLFSTYAAIWARKFMLAASDYQGRSIRVPAEIINDERKVRQTLDILTFSLNKIPTAEEIASKMGVTVLSVNRALEHAQQVVDSIYRPLHGDGDDRTLEDELADTSVSDLDKIEEAIDRENLIQEIRPLFSDREFFVIANHHGLYGPERILEDIGRDLGITKGGASYIELKAFRRVRENPEIMEKLKALFGA